MPSSLFFIFFTKAKLTNNSQFNRSTVSLCYMFTQPFFFSFYDRFLPHSLLRLQISSRPADVGRETHLKLVTARQLLVLIARFVRSPYT